jgi:probable addiction module antidote protein
LANGPVALAIYATADGRKPFQEWVESLKDFEAKARATGCILDRTAERSSSFCVAASRPLNAKTSQTRRDIGETIGAGNMARSVPYDDYLIESLKDHRLAEAYLNAALEEDDPRVFLLALRDVAQARGMSKLAARSNLNRESLYKMLSKRGNPSLQSLGALLNGLGFRLAVESKDAA